MNKFYISALLLPVVCVGAAYANDCPNSISVAQRCVKQCVDDGPADGFDNKLQKCIETTSLFSQQLGQCCGMSVDCQVSVDDTNTCLDGSLLPVKESLIEYFSCVATYSPFDPYCHPQLCRGLLTGGHGTNSTVDFDLGEQGGLAALMRGATTCAPVDFFSASVCDSIGTCCRPCAPEIAKVTEAVTNSLLLPSYNQDLDQLGGCTNMTCNPPSLPPSLPPSPLPASRRQLEAEESATASGGDGDIAASTDAIVLATECNDDLEANIVVHNETHAVGIFFECISKKVGRIMMKAEQQGSSGSSSVLALKSFFSTVSAIASVILAIVVTH